MERVPFQYVGPALPREAPKAVRGRRKRPVLALVVNDVSGFKTLNSIIIPRLSHPIRLNTRRKNVNAIVITLGRFASPG